MPYSTSNKAEVAYMLDSLASELRGISTSAKPKNSQNTYLTDVKHVERALFPKGDRQIAFSRPRPCILLWPERTSKIVRTIQDRRVSFGVYMIGIVSVPFSPDMDGAILQDQVLGLWDDVHRMMLNNPMRLHPEETDETANTYGFDSDDAGGVSTVFDEVVADQNEAIGAFASRYSVNLRMTR